MTFVSYAQNFEDVILWRALKHIEKGFYIDVGAQDPVIDSVSLGFYEHGWRGTHVEPNPTDAEAIKQARPDELVIQAAIGSTKGKIEFYDVANTGLSTGEKLIAEKHKAAGFKVRKTRVACFPLCEILNVHVEKEIHWLKIDVEGMEGQVMKSWAPSPVRPWIVVVESTRPNSPELSFAEWEPALRGLGYDFVYFDGLNRFYVSRKHPELKSSFGPGPNYFDDYVLNKELRANLEISNLQKQLKTNSILADELRSALNNTRKKIADKADQIASLTDDLSEARRNSWIIEARIAALKGQMVKANERFLWRIMSPLNSLSRFLRGVIPRKLFAGVRNTGITQVFTLGRSNRKTVFSFENSRRSKTLVIEIPCVVSPNQLGLGADSRSLGIGFIKLEIISTHGPMDKRVICFDDLTPSEFIENIVGLSTPESWGTWSLGHVVIFDFCNPLPEKFELHLNAFASSSNIGKTAIAHLFDPNSDELVTGSHEPIVSQGKLLSSRLATIWQENIRPKKSVVSTAEFMIDPQPDIKAEWQALIDNSQA